MRGAGKTIKEAERFLKTFGIEDGEAADAIARSANMLREAKGNGRIGGYVIYGSTCQTGYGEGGIETHYAVEVRCGGSTGRDGGDADPKALRVRASVTDEPRRLPEAVRRALRATDELKALASRCDMMNVDSGLPHPVVPVEDDAEGYSREGCYAEIADRGTGL